MVAMDYNSILIVTMIISDKKSSTVRASVEGWRGQGYITESLITDNGKEFRFRI